MTAAIGAVAAAAVPLPPLPTDNIGATGAAGGQGFGDMIAGALENVNGLQNKADSLAVQAATGTLSDVHDYTIAATEANLATELTVAVRNKALESFNEIMRMGG